MCMYVCMHLRTYTFVCPCVCTNVHMYIHSYLNVYIPQAELALEEFLLGSAYITVGFASRIDNRCPRLRYWKRKQTKTRVFLVVRKTL